MSVILWWKLSSHESYLVMKVIMVKEVMACDISPVVMFFTSVVWTLLNIDISIYLNSYFWWVILNRILIWLLDWLLQSTFISLAGNNYSELCDKKYEEPSLWVLLKIPYNDLNLNTSLLGMVPSKKIGSFITFQT